MRDDTADLLFDMALRKADEQHATLRELKQRASVLVASGVGAGGLLAGLVSRDDSSIEWWGTAGLALAGLCAVVLVTLVYRIWRPRRGWGFGVDVGKSFGWVSSNPNLTATQFKVKQLENFGEQLNTNEDGLGKMLKAFNRGLVVLFIQFAGIAAAAVDSIHV